MPARGYSVTPRKKRPERKPKVRVAPTLDQRRGQSAKRAESKVVVVKVKPKRDRDKTIGEVAAEQRLKTQVAAARKRPQRADTGDILKGTRKPKRSADALKRELEGTGQITKGSEALAKRVVKSPSGLGISVRAAGLIPGVGKLIERGVKDVINLPAQAVPSLYVPVAAAVEAAKGRPERAKKLGKDIQETDPLYATGEAAVKLATGDTKGAGKSIKRAGKLASEHPGFTAVEAMGVKGTIGRGATRVQRAAGKNPTRRAPAVLPGSDIKQTRAYSKDAFTRQGQKMTERNRIKRAEQRRAEAAAMEKRDPGRHADRIDELRAEADRIDPRRVRDTEIRKRAAERVAVNEQIRRENRTRVARETREAISPRPARLRPRRKATAADTLAIQAITDTSPADLAKYKREIAAEYEGLSNAGRKANRRLQSEIQKALDANPDPAALRESARRYAEIMRPRTKALIERGMLPAASADKAPLVPYAVRRMGATHGIAPAAVPVARGSGVRQAKAQRARATRAAETAARKAAREEGRTRLLAEQQGRRDLRTATMLEQQAKGLDEQAKQLVALSRKNMVGERRLDITQRSVGPESKSQRRYRQKAARLGVRKQGIQVGSQRYRAGQRQARRAEEMSNRAATLRDEAAAIRARPAGEQTRPARSLARLEKAQADVLATQQGRVRAQAAVKTAKAERKTAKVRARVPELLDPEGNPLTSKQIREHMRKTGTPEPAYVTQAPGRGGASAFYVSSNKPQSIPNITRTGAATRRGTFDAGPEVLAEGAARAQGLIDAADGFAASVKEFAHKPTLGKLKTKKDADAKARELAAETGVEWSPVRLNPFAGRQEQLKALLDAAGEGIDQPLGQRQPIREALEGAYRGEDGPGPWALIPRAAADEFAAHMQKMGVGPAGKVGQLVGQSFRRTVLSTSPTWFAGNIVEASLRSALAGAGPRSYKLGKDVLASVDEISPKLGQELRARAVGGGHFKSAEALHVRRGAEQFVGTRLEPMARALHAFWQTPGPKQAAHAWNAWTDLVFRQVNGRIESAYQTAMLGRALRDTPLMDPKLPALSKRAVEQAARGLTNTNEQIAMARAVERMYGKYNGFNAGTRWAIAMYTPFIPWTLNAVKFVFDVLPRDHPTVTALIAASEQWTEEWRKDHGLDLFMDEAVPGFLQGSIPLGGDAKQRAPHRYTPFGAFGDPLDTAAKAVLPQYQGVLAAFKGEDWKGSPLRNKDGSEMDALGKAGMAAQSFTEATVPLVGIIKRVAKKGPGSLNPLNPVKPPKKKAKVRARSRSIDAQLDAALGGGGSIDRQLDEALGGMP